MLGLSRRHHDQFPRQGSGRGRSAGHPGEIPALGWKDILWRTYEQQSTDNIGMIAAGVAYYGMLALFPAVAALVSLYGLVLDPGAVESQFDQLAGVLPGDVLSIMRDQASKVASTPQEGLTLGVVFGLLLTLWSASRGTNALIAALNIAYDEPEKRGFITLALMSIGFTLAGLAFLVLTLALIVAVPAAIAALGLTGPIAWVLSLARWPILGGVVMLVLALLYRYAPSRNRPRWQWVSWGAGVATLIWLGGSALFSLYVSNFGSYNETYGSVGAVVVLLLWMNLTAYVVLMGAELNSEIEHQTARDTTEGPTKPLGHRDAYVADTVGRKRA